MRATDQGVPVKSVEAAVEIRVTRNQFPPEFRNAPYQQTVSENVVNGTGIFTVTAEDQDLQVSEIGR